MVKLPRRALLVVAWVHSGQGALVPVEEGQARGFGKALGGGEVAVHGGDGFGPGVGGFGVEGAGLAGAEGQGGARGLDGVAPWWEAVGEGEGGAGGQEVLGVDGQGRPCGRGGSVGVVGTASRWSPGQGCAEAQGAGAVQDVEGVLEVA